MLAEDHEYIRENVAEILELAKYPVIKAKNGLEGVNIMQQVQPDLVISDVQMPEADGYYLPDAVRHNKKPAGIPFIFLSCSIEKKDIGKCLAMGANDYLLKPFQGEELLEKTAAYLTS